MSQHDCDPTGLQKNPRVARRILPWIAIGAFVLVLIGFAAPMWWQASREKAVLSKIQLGMGRDEVTQILGAIGSPRASRRSSWDEKYAMGRFLVGSAEGAKAVDVYLLRLNPAAVYYDSDDRVVGVRYGS